MVSQNGSYHLYIADMISISITNKFFPINWIYLKSPGINDLLRLAVSPADKQSSLYVNPGRYKTVLSADTK